MAEVSTAESIKRDSLMRFLGGKAFASTMKIESLFRLIDAAGSSFFVFDKSNNTIIIYNSAGTAILTINLSTGDVTVPENKFITPGTEFYMPISIEHTFTGSGGYLDNTGASFKLNADDFPGFSFAYQATMSVEQAGRTAYSQLYNITDVVAVTGSEITSTAVGITGHAPIPIRSGGLTFPSGEKEYIAQRKQSPAGDGGDNMHMYLAMLVFIKT